MDYFMRKVEKTVTTVIVHYDDGTTSDYSIGCTIAELIEYLPEHARAKEQYWELMGEVTKSDRKDKKRFCRELMIALMAQAGERVIDWELEDFWKLTERAWNKKPKGL